MNAHFATICSTLIGIAVLAGSNAAAQAQHFHHHSDESDSPRCKYGYRGGASDYRCNFEKSEFGPSDFQFPHFDESATPFLETQYEGVNEGTADPSFAQRPNVAPLLGQLETQLNLLCLDLAYNYTHNPGFQETYVETYTVLQGLLNLQNGDDLAQLESIVQCIQDVQSMLPHIEGDVQEWTRHQQRQVGRGGAKSKLAEIETTVGQLNSQLGIPSLEMSDDDAGNDPALQVAPSPDELLQPARSFRSRPASRRSIEDQSNDPPQPRFPSSNNDEPEFESGGPAFEQGAPIE